MKQFRQADFNPDTLYNRYFVEIQFRNRVYGALPKTQKMVETYVKAKFQSDDAEKTLTDLDLVQETEKVMTGFKRDKNGLYMPAYAIKAGIKQFTSLCKLTVQKRGTKQTTKEAAFVKGYAHGTLYDDKCHFLPLAEKPGGLEDFAGQVSTPQGERSILKSVEYLERPFLQFQIWVLRARMTSPKDLAFDDLVTVLSFGQECGFGAQRSFEAGKYDLLEITELAEGEHAPEIHDPHDTLEESQAAG